MRPGEPALLPEALTAPSFGELFAGLPIAILVVDPDGLVRNANGECELLLNLSERAMRGLPLTHVLTPPPGAGSDGEGRGVSAFDYDIGTDRTGRLRVDYIETAIVDRPGWRAITLHPAGGARRVGQSAERGGARAAIGAAAMLAHEIKNPLSGIRGAAQLLAAEGAGHELTSLITTEVDRIAALIDKMQDFTGRALAPQPHNIHALLDHARRVAATGFASGVAIEESFDPSLPRVLVDGDALLQIVINLLKNAAEALDGVTAPRIQLRTAYRHGLAVDAGPGQPRRALPIELCVADNGPGAPADIADHLFEPFVSGKPEGQGLGLALVDKLVRDMGGVVQYAREGVPEMTVFRILLARGE
ncbi:MAG: two-component sensor histidine kinase [Sphingomonas sp.]|uniref:two-component system sensor histidine kinase NtrB n=1 Tax=Sphingomonas sp. TaxID=28214 RepID=UPI001ACD957D|nr:ATP-binding protein [Sphingomonas sp.]MBN8807393.1 two-component sensor histidine kinase [Sphingomonas sp.]